MSLSDKVEDLRRVAEAATEGPWMSEYIGGSRFDEIWMFGHESRAVGSIGVIANIMSPGVNGLKENAKYVEAFDPRTSSALLNVVAAAIDGTDDDRLDALRRLDSVLPEPSR